jgi:hypothetical protein
LGSGVSARFVSGSTAEGSDIASTTREAGSAAVAACSYWGASSATRGASVSTPTRSEARSAATAVRISHCACGSADDATGFVGR